MYALIAIIDEVDHWFTFDSEERCTAHGEYLFWMMEATWWSCLPLAG